MITLLTNLTKLSHYDDTPLENDTSSSADLARIKYYRNYISHHISHKDGKIDSVFFNKAWNEICLALRRLSDQDMQDNCIELKTKCLDWSTVPWNIRVQINQVLEEWKDNAGNFVETKAAKHVFDCVQGNNCVTITDSSGFGKTATLRHVAFKMAAAGYDIQLVTSPHDIVRFYNPDQKTLFVIDDFCGIYSINQLDLSSWETVIERIKVLIQNKVTKIMVACRLQVYQNEQFKTLSIFKICVCNLQSENLCLSKTEKQSIAELYMEADASKVMQFCDLYECFPLLCKLYNDNTELNMKDFFQNPFSVYDREIDKFQKRGHFKKYCSLALCVMFYTRLDEELLTEEVNKVIRKMIENTCETCKLDRGKSRLILQDELKSLENTFFRKKHNVYKTIHDKLFDFLVYYFGKKMIKCLIMNADSWVISERFVLEKKAGMFQFITVVPSKYHMLYIGRMIHDWSEGKVAIAFQNINMKVPEFRQKFLCHLKTLDISLQKQLALTYDVNYKDSTLLRSCHLQDITFIQRCISHGVDCNHGSGEGVRPLHVSAQGGHIDAVKVLLKNQADINTCSDEGTFPLYVACQNNHLEIVKVLLDSKANINKCTNDGTSPLYCACHNNHIEMVNVLIYNNADINKCENKELSALCIACYNNNSEIVHNLLINKADIHKCMDDGVSPLFIACHNNHIETVKILIENKAEVNK